MQRQNESLDEVMYMYEVVYKVGFSIHVRRNWFVNCMLTRFKVKWMPHSTVLGVMVNIVWEQQCQYTRLV
jgi:hypothetical protein